MPFESLNEEKKMKKLKIQIPGMLLLALLFIAVSSIMADEEHHDEDCKMMQHNYHELEESIRALEEHGSIPKEAKTDIKKDLQETLKDLKIEMQHIEDKGERAMLKRAIAATKGALQALKKNNFNTFLANIKKIHTLLAGVIKAEGC